MPVQSDFDNCSLVYAEYAPGMPQYFKIPLPQIHISYMKIGCLNGSCQ